MTAQAAQRGTPADGGPEARRPVVVACDLDRTLMYSAAALELSDEPVPPLVVAEVYEDAPLSFWTAEADALLGELAAAAWLVPTTTRTRAQYHRVRFPGGPPRYAVTSNGGHVLVDGEACPEWSADVARRLAAASAPLAEVTAHLARSVDAAWLLKRRVAEDLFAYLVVDRAAMPAPYVAELEEWCAERGWRVSVQGRKVYAVPSPLSKSGAVAEVARRVGAGRVLAAGDSLLDTDLLESADLALRPAHGELHDTGWLRPHVTVTRARGVLAGQEIVARLLAAVRAA